MPGYSCKAQLAYEIAAKHFEARHYTWLSAELNPVQNGDSSNPLKIYETLDRAVKLGDVNSPKIKDLRANLMQAVDFRYGLSDPDLAGDSRNEVQQAPMTAFRPQLWKIQTESVDVARIRRPLTNSSWDEQLVVDLASHEFEVIVE